MQILIVEDEPKIAKALKRGLEQERYSVDVAHDGEKGWEKAEVNEYDLIILDHMLPKMDGVTLCRAIRKTNTATPILFLTAKDSIEDKIRGLDAGADDYVTKPFTMDEITARIRALLRRGNKADPTVLVVADVRLDPATKEVTRGTVSIEITAREYALLEYLMRNKNHIVSKSQILEHVWDYSYEGMSNIVETYIKYIRQKLAVAPDSPELIHTRRGIGYVMSETQ